MNIDRWRRRRIVLAGAAFTIGIVVLLVGLVITQAVIGSRRSGPDAALPSAAAPNRPPV